MRKFLAFIAVLILCGSCTENFVARNLGGTLKVEVEKGYRVTSATWKADGLFYFIEPMPEDYQPQTKKFIENSGYGVMDGMVVFIESK